MMNKNFLSFLKRLSKKIWTHENCEEKFFEYPKIVNNHLHECIKILNKTVFECVKIVRNLIRGKRCSCLKNSGPKITSVP